MVKWIGSQLVEEEFFPFEYTTRIASSMSLRLPKLYQYCLDMGITPAKSLTLDVKLDDKSEEFKLGFLRGVIDGDGSVTKEVKPRRSIRIFSASERFIDTLKSNYGGLKVFNRSARKGKGMYELHFSSKKSLIMIKPRLLMDSFTLNRKTTRLRKLYEYLCPGEEV